MEENKTPEELQDKALDQVAGGIGTASADSSEDEPLSLGNGSIPILGEPRKREHRENPSTERRKKSEAARKKAKKY